MTYRDTFDTCPRCGVSLVDARSARACSECKGLWIEEPVVSEMVLEMLPPQPFGRLVLAVLERSSDPLACPTCKEPMQATELHGVPLDRCAKQHGVWFDAGELQLALQRVADPARTPPLGPSVEAEQLGRGDQVIGSARHEGKLAGGNTPAPHVGERPGRTGDEPPIDWVLPIEFRFTIHAPGQPARELVVANSIVKIGRAQTAHVQLADPRVSRLHAIIDASGGNATLIDLGAEGGTLVNGQRVLKTQLQSGDQILVGATTLVVTFAFA